MKGLGLVFNIMYNNKAMYFIKKNWNKIVFLACASILPVISFAQGDVPAPCTTSGKICNPIGTTSIPNLIQNHFRRRA